VDDQPEVTFRTGEGERNQLTFLTVMPPPWQPGNGPAFFLNGVRMSVGIGRGLVTSGGYERYKEGRKYYLFAKLSPYDGSRSVPDTYKGVYGQHYENLCTVDSWR